MLEVERFSNLQMPTLLGLQNLLSPNEFFLTHSFGSETITVEPPVTCNFRISLFSPTNYNTPYICPNIERHT